MMSMLQTSFGLVSIVQTNIFMHNEMLKSKKQNAQFHCVLSCHSAYRCSSAPVQIQPLFEPPKVHDAEENHLRSIEIASGILQETQMIKCMRQRGDLNPCGQSPMDFESITLTTRSHCRCIAPSQRPPDN